MDKLNEHTTVPELPRVMGLFSATMLGVGAMIGAGIFLLSGIAAGHAGPAVILAFIANGFIAIAIGGCYAELSSAMPRAGGSYYWMKQALGSKVGFAVGWISCYANVIAAALYALGFGTFVDAVFDYFYPAKSGVNIVIPAAVLLTTLVTALHYEGARDTTIAENSVTVLKIVLLLVLVGGGFFAIESTSAMQATFTPFTPNGFVGVAMAMAITFVAFEGFEVITRTGEEIIAPEKNMPRAIFISISIAVSLYVLIAIVLIAVIKSDDGMASWQYLGSLGELGMASTADQILPFGDLVFYVAGIASTASAMIAATFSAIRVAFAMGRLRDLHPRLAALHRKHNSPYIAATLCGGLVLLVIFTLPVIEVAGAASQMFALLFAIVCFGAWRLRKIAPDMDRPFRLACLPWFASVGIVTGLLVFATLLNISPLAWSISVVWLMIGAFMYSRRSPTAS